MVDPLSVAGLALAIASLGLQVTGGITDYFDSLKSRDQDIASIIQQNDALRKTLQIIELSISRFQNDHGTATETLRQFLHSSNEELKVLEAMVVTLNIEDQGTGGQRNKARNKGKKLLYPFHRPKLEQMATKLHHINATLQLGLQSLGLQVNPSIRSFMGLLSLISASSVSHLGSEKLATLQATSQTISSDILVVQSEVSAISTPIQGIQTTMSQFETRFNGLENLLGQLLVQGSAINEALQEITPEIVTRRLLRKPAVLQEMCDAVGTRAQHKPKRNVPATSENAIQTRKIVTRYTGGRFSCLCRHRRHLQHKTAAWGPLRFSHETTIEQHAPGCPATEAITEIDRSSKFALTYVGLRFLLNSALQISFSIRSGAGGWSLGPNFTYYPSVDSQSAPAFRMLELLMESHFYLSSACKVNAYINAPEWQDGLLPSVVSSMLDLFRAKKASPPAVDEENASLVHKLAEVINSVYGDDDLSLYEADHWQSSPLFDLLQYLLINEAPANEYNTCGVTAVGKLFGIGPYGKIGYPFPAACADLILRSNSEDTLAYQPRGITMIFPGEGQQNDFLSYSNLIARAYGCGPLSLAVLSNNLEEVKLLVARHPSTLYERNLLGHSPLHLAADKPLFLRVIVEAADTDVLNYLDGSNHSALGLAVCLSGLNCKGPKMKMKMCKGCTCAESAVILLKADCAVPISSNLGQVLNNASKRCKLRYVRHMKDRRDRLKQLGLENLSRVDIERLALESEHILDYNAFEVTQLLEESNIRIPTSLAISHGNSGPVSVYGELESPGDAEIFFRSGFGDTWAWCDTGIMERKRIPGLRWLPYLRWLVNHGGISNQLPLSSSKDVFGCHCIFWAIGYHIRKSWKRTGVLMYPSSESESSSSLLTPRVLEDEISWFHEVHTAVFAASVEDTCSCECSIGGYTMLRFLLKGLVDDCRYHLRLRCFHTGSSKGRASSGHESLEGYDTREKSLLKLIDDFITYLEHFYCHLRPRHHYATLRYITHTALGIHHSCYIDKDSCRACEGLFYPVKDGFEYDESHKLDLLEDLLEEFNGSITSILEDPIQGVSDLIYFWERTWVRRMVEVLDLLEGDDLPEAERRGAEEIGVVWNNVGPEPPVVMGNPYHKSSIEDWLHELRKIEEECQ